MNYTMSTTTMLFNDGELGYRSFANFSNAVHSSTGRRACVQARGEKKTTLTLTHSVGFGDEPVYSLTSSSRRIMSLR